MPLVRKDSPVNRIPGALTYSVCPLHNPQLFVYESNALGSPARASALIQVSNISELTDGYYLEINGVRIYFRDAPTPGDLPSVSIAGGAADILQSIALQLRRLPSLAGAYAVQYLPTVETRVRALNDGTAYNLTLAQPGTGLLLNASPGVNGVHAQSKTRYQVYCDVWYDADAANTPRIFDPVGIPETQADFKPVATLAKTYAGTNTFEFDVSPVLKNLTRNQPPRYADVTLPNGGYPVHEIANLMLVRYAVEVGEEWTDDTGRTRRIPAERLGWGYDADDPKYMLWGAKSALPAMLGFGGVFTQYRYWWRRRGVTSGGVRFLTTQPGEKWSHVQAVEYLYYFWERGADNMTHLDVRFDFIFADCTDLNEQYFDIFKVELQPSQRYGGVFYTEVSPRTFDWRQLELDAGSALAGYTVTIVEHDGDTGNAVPVSQPQAFLLSDADRCAEINTVVMWLNPLGGYDTWTPSAAVVKRGRAEQQTHDAPITYAALPSRVLTANGYPDYARIASTRAYDGAAETGYELNTGWVDAETYEWLKTLTESLEVYVIRFDDADTRGGGAVQPRLCHRAAQAEWKKNEREDMYALKLELTLGYPANLITK